MLKTINGEAPPAIFSQSASQYLMLDTATLRISANSTYSDIRNTTLHDVTGIHTATRTRTGTYTVSGNTITLAFTNDLGIPDVLTYTLSGTTLSGVESGVALTFKK